MSHSVSQAAKALILGAGALLSLSFAPATGPTPFVDPLPIPTRLKFPQGGTVTITETQISMKVHRDLPAAPQWAYNGTSPGPTIEVESGQQLIVHWVNQLPSTHIYALPAHADVITPDVRTVTHLHGAAVPEPDIAALIAGPRDHSPDNDGWPDAWMVKGQEQVATYPNIQAARTLWYHDHAMGTTGRNVAAGLLGTYEIHDAYERSLNLPADNYDIPLMIQSRQLNADGTLSYTTDIGNEFYGNAGGVNGVLTPYLNVEPRKYRFRIINSSNARTYGLKLEDQTPPAAGAIDPPPFVQIGTDGGFLATPVTFPNPPIPTSLRMLLAPAERADVIIDFTKYAGRNFVLTNNNRDIGDIEASIPQIMLFRVAGATTGPDSSALPTVLAPIARIPESAATVTRRVVFDQMTMPDGSQMLTLNGKRWSDPIAETPTLGATEIWELTNTLFDIHPFHIHQMAFQVLDRRLFDVAHFLSTGEVVYTGDAQPPAPNEMGWKDTIKAYPQMVTRIILKMGPYPGYFVYHCHILEHEDMDMMRPFQIDVPDEP